MACNLTVGATLPSVNLLSAAVLSSPPEIVPSLGDILETGREVATLFEQALFCSTPVQSTTVLALDVARHTDLQGSRRGEQGGAMSDSEAGNPRAETGSMTSQVSGEIGGLPLGTWRTSIVLEPRPGFPPGCLISLRKTRAWTDLLGDFRAS